MNLCCVRMFDSIKPEYSDLIVFPEYSSFDSIMKAATSYPQSIVVGAAMNRNNTVGLLFHYGQLRLRYYKIESDGRTVGSNDIKQSPWYETHDTIIGMLICKDVDNVEFSAKVIKKVKSGNHRHKIICIPAEMDSQWFSSDSLDPRFMGVNVVLCNNDKTYQVRCKNFVTDTNGKKIVTSLEDIYYPLP